MATKNISQQNENRLPLPKGWTKKVQASILHLFSLARLTVEQSHADAEENKDANPFQVRIKRLEHEIRLLKERIRISDARMQRIPAACRPRYTPVERLQILELKSVRSWSLRQTAKWQIYSAGQVYIWA